MSLTDSDRLIQSIDRLVQAIGKLVDSNQMLVDVLVTTEPEDPPVTHYLDGTPIQ